MTAIVDETGAVLERYGYDGFGRPRYMRSTFSVRLMSWYDWEILFHGYRYDLETGLYQVRHRYLHPELGRWLSRDPIGEEGGLNLYRFVGNDPVNRIDYLGLFIKVNLKFVPKHPQDVPVQYVNYGSIDPGRWIKGDTIINYVLSCFCSDDCSLE